MSITAKFAGTCNVCCKAIHPGDKIEWQKGKGSTHLSCVGKTPEPLNSRPPKQMIPADADLVALAAAHARTIEGQPKLVSFYGDPSTKVGGLMHSKGGRYLVLAVGPSNYYSADYLEDMDMFSMRPGRYSDIQTVRVAPTAEESAAETDAKLKKEAKARQEAADAAAAKQELVDTVLPMFPFGIRRATKAEYDAAWSAIQQYFGRDWKVSPAELIYERKSGKGNYRLPEMPGNDKGHLGFTHIFRVAGRLVVWHDGAVSGDYAGGASIQAVEIVEADGDLLADYATRRAIKGYRYDPALYDLLVGLDRDRKICGATSWFGGTPVADREIGPCTQHAYGYEYNDTAAELRTQLAEYLQKSEDPRSRQAIEILRNTDSITTY